MFGVPTFVFDDDAATGSEPQQYGAARLGPALGESWGRTYSFGFGSPARPTRPSTIRCRRGASVSETGRARYMRSTILSENQ